MTDDTTTKIVIFLLIFWSGILLVTGSGFVKNVVSVSTNADINSLGTGVTLSNFEALWNIMTFQITGTVYTFVAAIMTIIEIMTLVVAYKLIFGR